MKGREEREGQAAVEGREGRARGIRAISPRLANAPRRGGRVDRAVERERTPIERLIRHLKAHRRIGASLLATRYEQIATSRSLRATSYEQWAVRSLSLGTLAAIPLWL